MSKRRQVWVLSLLGVIALAVPACDSDDGESNDNHGGSAGAGGKTNTGGKSTTGGKTNTAGSSTTAGTGFGGDGGNGAGGGGAGGGGAGGGGAGGAPECGQLDEASGVVSCGELKFRAAVGEGCLYSPPDQEPSGGGAGGATGGAGATHGGAGGADSGCDPSQCTEKPRGYCEAEAPGAAGAGPVTCHYGCLTDSDCGATELCLCADPAYGGRCVQTFCKTDADCTNGNRCGSSSACDQFSCNEEPSCAVH